MYGLQNAANEPLAGCNIPNHCIDSAICTAAGPELQKACEWMTFFLFGTSLILLLRAHMFSCGLARALGPIDAGEVRLTAGYNLLCPWVLHVVGPRAGYPTDWDEVTGEVFAVAPPNPIKLAQGYKACLDLCREKGIRSFAMCCLSTGMFGYPKQVRSAFERDVCSSPPLS